MSNIKSDSLKHSLGAMVYEKLRSAILDGELKKGDNLIETKIAQEMGVSRTPVREALRQLEQDDLVVSVPNRGAVVQGISKQDVEDIYVIRQLLEGQAAKWASERIDAQELAALREVVELMDFYTKRNDAKTLAKLDTTFHNMLYKACNSRTLRHTLADLHRHSELARLHSLAQPMRAKYSLEEHRAIYGAIADHDAQNACRLITNHISHAIPTIAGAAYSMDDTQS